MAMTFVVALTIAIVGIGVVAIAVLHKIAAELNELNQNISLLDRITCTLEDFVASQRECK